MLNVLVNVGLPLAGLKEHVDPEGRPLAQDRLTVCDEPLTKAAVIVFEPEPPCWIVVMAREAESEKSKGEITLNCV